MPKREKQKETEPEQETEVEPSISEVEGIQDLAGVGDKTEGKLREAGYETVEILAVTNPERLTELDIEPSAAKKIIASARKYVSRVGVNWKTAEQVMREHEASFKLSLRVPIIDTIIGGKGLESRSITIVHGKFATGKSNLCFWTTACALTNPELKDGKVLYIDTENSFRPERVQSFLRTLGGSDEDLKRIIVSEAYSSSHQQLIVDHASKIIKEQNVKLLVLDSLTAHFRAEYLGREMLNPRQQRLNDHLAKIMKLTRLFDLVTLVTTQEIDMPQGGFMGAAESKGAGGNITGHRPLMILSLWKPDGMSEKRFLTVEKHPSLPMRREVVRLNEQGFSEFDATPTKKPEPQILA